MIDYLSEVMMKMVYDRNKDGFVDSIDENVIKRFVAKMVGVDDFYENIWTILDVGMLYNMKSGEVVNGGISFDKDELKIVGGTATAAGDSWVYYDLGGAKRVKISCYMYNGASSGGISYIDFVSGDISQNSGSGTSQYRVYIDIGQTAEDFRLDKDIDGTVTNLGYEGVDLSSGVWYKVVIDVDCVSGVIKVYRNNIEKFLVSDSDIDKIDYLRFLYSDSSTTAALYGGWGCPVVITWE